MKFIKKHKKVIKIILAIIIIGIIGSLSYIAIKSMLPDNKNKYGNRLDGIEEVVITDEQVQNLEKEINEIKDVKNVKYNLQGRLIYIIIEVSNETAVEVSKGYANKCLAYFTDEQTEYYDIQVLIKSDSQESEAYPIIGAKHKTSKSFIWTENKKKETK